MVRMQAQQLVIGDYVEERMTIINCSSWIDSFQRLPLERQIAAISNDYIVKYRENQ